MTSDGTPSATRVDRDGRVDRDDARARAEQRRQRRADAGSTRMFGDARRSRRVDVRRLGRMRLDHELHVRASSRTASTSAGRNGRASRSLAANSTSARDSPAPASRRDALERPPASARGPRATSVVERALPVTASASAGKRPAVARCARRVVVEEQRRGRTTGSRDRPRLRGIRERLVRLVPVVQPVAVDEAVLQARRAGCRAAGIRARARVPSRRPRRR